MKWQRIQQSSAGTRALEEVYYTQEMPLTHGFPCWAHHSGDVLSKNAQGHFITPPKMSSPGPFKTDHDEGPCTLLRLLTAQEAGLSERRLALGSPALERWRPSDSSLQDPRCLDAIGTLRRATAEQAVEVSSGAARLCGPSLGPALGPKDGFHSPSQGGGRKLTRL